MTALIPSIFGLIALVYVMLADISKKVDAIDKSTQEAQPYQMKVRRVKMNRRPRSLRVKP